jgi:phosphoribosylanthranilate isomerase
MMRARIKICGLTGEEAIDAAIESGADAVGFVFAPSPRRVTPERAVALARRLPSFVLKVAVFADATAEEVREVTARLAPDRIQIEAGSSDALGGDMRARVLPVFHDGPKLLQEVASYREASTGDPTILLDGRLSGRGETADWGVAAQVARTARVVLAGGLNPENVVLAIRIVRPYAVDVSSGVESSPGVKDPIRIAAFVAAVRAAEVEK